MLNNYQAPVATLTYTTTRQRWQFPQDRFVEYESSDEPMCRKLGIGKEVTEEVMYVTRARICNMSIDAPRRSDGPAVARMQLEMVPSAEILFTARI